MKLNSVQSIHVLQWGIMRALRADVLANGGTYAYDPRRGQRPATLHVDVPRRGAFTFTFREGTTVLLVQEETTGRALALDTGDDSSPAGRVRKALYRPGGHVKWLSLKAALEGPEEAEPDPTEYTVQDVPGGWGFTPADIAAGERTRLKGWKVDGRPER